MTRAGRPARRCRRSASPIQRARERAGLTQKQVAAELGVHPITVCRWEKEQPSHRDIPMDDRFGVIAQLLQISEEEVQEWYHGWLFDELPLTPPIGDHARQIALWKDRQDRKEKPRM